MTDEEIVVTVEVPPDPDVIVVEVPGDIDLIVTEIPGQQGPPGPRGERGPPGIANALVVEQSAPSASWVISHGFGRRPLVQVFDDAGELVYPDVVAGKANVSVIFSVASTGSVVLF